MSLRKKPTPASINIKRVAAVIACIVCMSFAVIGGLLHKSGIIDAVNPAADETAERVLHEMMLETTTEGRFLDRNGYALTEVEGPGIPAEIIFPESMSYIIGYNSAKYSLSGLRQRYSDYLFNGGKDNKGADITLTIDAAGLQEFCYQLLEGHEGSISVIDADGEILALASRSHPVVDYNANDIENRFDEFNSLPAFYLNRATMAEDPPGSTFKLITAAAMLENDMEEYTFDDPGELWISDSYAIHNFNNDRFGNDITLDKALEKSINTYFASAGIILGPARIQDIAERFGYGTEIELDFATLKSNVDMGNMADKALTASTSYGQGRLSVSPLQINMMMQAVLNNKGEMLRPYMISSIVNDGKTVYKGSSEVLLKSISPKVANRLCELLHNTAIHYGYDDPAFGKVYAKTGTAEMANGKNHIYLALGQRCASGGTYSIVIDHRNVDVASRALHKTAESILNYIAYYDLNKIGGTTND